MKVLMVNNRLKVYGGEGTYMTSLGDEFIRQGHDVQYFGLKDPDNLHGNRYGIYAKATKNPFKLAKNDYNRKQFAKILDAFQPDVIHLNLIYFTLTPSILVEAKKRNIKVVQTIHDGKMVCPSYQLYLHDENKPCTLCVNGDFKNCLRHNCHKNSKLFSYIAFKEAEYNRRKKYYDLIDKFIFPSNFMRNLHVQFGLPKDKTEVLCNFSRITKRNSVCEKKEKYVLFFGRLTRIKGIEMVAKAASLLPHIKFVIAGDGDERFLFDGLHNCRVMGFLEKTELSRIIENAYLTVFPSVCLENCPMSIAESISLGTPVLGSNIGGVPELIDENKTGILFNSEDINEFVNKINYLWEHEELIHEMSKKCNESSFLDCERYAKTIVKKFYQ